MYKSKQDYGLHFERVFTAIVAIAAGIIIMVLSIKGPLYFNDISFKTHPLIVNQLMGQDAINLFPISFMLIIGGLLLFYKKNVAKYILICTPLYLFYYALSYAMGWEWMAEGYSGLIFPSCIIDCRSYR